MWYCGSAQKLLGEFNFRRHRSTVTYDRVRFPVGAIIYIFTTASILVLGYSSVVNGSLLSWVEGVGL
jgi:hypothetical protein